MIPLNRPFGPQLMISDAEWREKKTQTKQQQLNAETHNLLSSGLPRGCLTIKGIKNSGCSPTPSFGLCFSSLSKHLNPVFGVILHLFYFAGLATIATYVGTGERSQPSPARENAFRNLTSGSCSWKEGGTTEHQPLVSSKAVDGAK